MRFLRKEAEGGWTIADWNGGFAAICPNGHGPHKFQIQYERCPCCHGAVDFRLKFMSLELVVYNDGGPCEWEAYLDELEQEMSIKELTR